MILICKYFQYISDYGVPAVEGFFKSIALSHGNSLQDTLRLLTLWFDYGSSQKVYEAIVKGIQTIEIGTWLQVSGFYFQLHCFTFLVELSNTVEAH